MKKNKKESNVRNTVMTIILENSRKWENLEHLKMYRGHKSCMTCKYDKQRKFYVSYCTCFNFECNSNNNVKYEESPILLNLGEQINVFSVGDNHEKKNCT